MATSALSQAQAKAVALDPPAEKRHDDVEFAPEAACAKLPFC